MFYDNPNQLCGGMHMLRLSELVIVKNNEQHKNKEIININDVPSPHLRVASCLAHVEGIGINQIKY